jgi:TonB-dependent Receptor Plug Domain
MSRKKTKVLCLQVIKNSLVLILLLTGLFAKAQNTSSPLRSILNDLEERYKVSFTYADETIENISIPPPADSLNITEVLVYLRKSTSLNFNKLDSRFITISSKIAEKINICGFLIDAGNQAIIGGATIQVDDQLDITNKDGYFSLLNVSNNSMVYVRVLGYQSQSFLAGTVGRKTPCTMVKLIPDVTRLREVMVRNYLTSGINKQIDGSFKLNIENLGILPGLTEPDVLQTIQALPGIQSINETVSHINVRGGTNDQNLVLWDGIKMYQTGHFFGLISIFNPYTSKEVNVVKNGTGTAFDEGVSSTIDIRSDDNLAEKFTGGAGINMINADLFVKVPVTKKLTLQVSGRRAITDLIPTPAFNQYFERAFGNSDFTRSSGSNVDTTFNSDENFYFYDIGADVLYNPTPKDKIRFHFLNVFNELDYQENLVSSAGTDSKNSSLTQQSLATGVQYHRLWNSHLSTTAQLYLSSYKLRAVNFDVANNQRLVQENEVLDTGLKLDARWGINNRWDLLSGYQFLEVGIGNLEELNNPEFRRYIKKVIRTHVAFTEANYLTKSGKTNVRFGIRANYFTKFNLAVIEPRISFNQKVFNYFSIDVLGEFKSQTATQVIDLQNDFLGVEKRRWVLANQDDIPIVKSKQISAGINFNKNGLLVSVESFYKYVSGITSSSQGFQNQFQFVRAPGNYTVSGIEFLVNQQFDKISAWVGYAYSDNQYTFATFNPTEFPNNLNITHTVSSGINVELQQFELSAGLNWRTGKPYTIPQGLDNGTIIYQSPNEASLPDYLRVDFSARYNFNLSDGLKAQIGASIWNLTNNQNIINIYYQVDDNGELKEIQQFALGMTPNLMFRVSF